MGGIANLSGLVNSKWTASVISSVGASNCGHSSSKSYVAFGLRGVALSSRHSLHGSGGIRKKSQCPNQSLSLHLSSQSQMDAKSFAGVTLQSRRNQQRMISSALSSVETEEKVWEMDSPKMKEMVAFLERDLVHLFDDQGIDKSMYDDKVDFRDPITKYGGLNGYLFNIQMLRWVLGPKFELHSVKQTGPTDITTRWTMTMNFLPLPWKPEIIFTGTSLMTVNKETGKFSRHWDFWDSIQNNEYFSLEAVGDLFKQLRIYKTPDLETPKYRVLKRTSTYEVRKYEEFLVAETDVDKIVGSKGFNEVAGYLFGKNSTGEKMKMTTPVFNQAADNSSKLQFVLPLKSQLSSLPSPLSEQVKVHPVAKDYAAVIKFNGETSEEVLMEKERQLRATLSKDGLNPEDGFLLARYNDPGSTWPVFRRNEVIIWLKAFTMQI